MKRLSTQSVTADFATGRTNVLTWTEIASGHWNNAAGGSWRIGGHRHDNLDRPAAAVTAVGDDPVAAANLQGYSCVENAPLFAAIGTKWHFRSSLECGLCSVHMTVYRVIQSVGCLARCSFGSTDHTRRITESELKALQWTATPFQSIVFIYIIQPIFRNG